MAESKLNEGKEEHLKSKPKAVYLEERLQKWKEHFKNLLRKPPEITDKPIKQKN